MTTTTKKVTIALSEGRPVTVSTEAWPVVAIVKDHDGQVECQANNEWFIKVRQHADGRAIVYGCQQAGNGGQHAGTRNPHAGYMIKPERGEAEHEAAIVRAIRRVAGVIGRDDLGEDCIADLPAREVE